MAIATPLQRSRGVARIGFAADEAGQSRLKVLHQAGAARVRLPRVHDDDRPHAVLINTAGGLTGGDSFATAVTLDRGARAVVTTQACEKVYRARDEAAAEVATAIALAEGSELAWLPQETIVFDGARLTRRLEVELQDGARFLGVESFILGRQAMGETVRFGALDDRWSIRRDGRLLFADALRLDGDIGALAQRPAVLAGNRAFATLVACGPECETVLAPLRTALGEAGAASAFDGRLVARLACADGRQLRAALVRALDTMMEGRPLPRVWHA